MNYKEWRKTEEEQKKKKQEGRLQWNVNDSKGLIHQSIIQLHHWLIPINIHMESIKLDKKKRL